MEMFWILFFFFWLSLFAVGLIWFKNEKGDKKE